MRRIVLFAFLFVSAFLSNAQVVINEYSCSNVNTTLDAFGQYEDWVELYNSGGAGVNLTGYYLSDNPSNLMKWQIPAVTPINSLGRKMIYCSGRGVIGAGNQIHPDFKLTQTKGEWFILSNASGIIVDSIHLNLTQRGHSRGREIDGASSWAVFTTPTPNASNGTSTPYSEYATKPIFSLAPGFYSGTQSVSISTPDPNITLRYTTDGSTPTATSTPFTVPISIPATTVIRARAFSSSPNIAVSFTETNTYLINETTTFNVISVSGPYTTNLFSTGASITTSFEYFDKNQNFILEYEGRAQRHGHDSWAYPQKGFKVYAKDEYGYENTMEHKFFQTSLRDEFDMVILKAGASDSYPGGPPKACHMRDMFAHTLSEKYGLDLDFRRYTPTIVFVNGQYWGVYEIRERVDVDYFDYYYGVKESNVDNLKYWGGLQTSPGTTGQWTSLVNYIFNNSMTNPVAFQYVKDSLNLKSFAQYFVFNQYLVNSDWLNWNSQWWRGRGPNNVKWRYVLWDEDNILDLGQNYSGWPTTTYNADPCDPLNGAPLGSTSVPHTTMLDSLLKNPEFEALYKQQWLDMLNGCFKCENILAHFDSLHNLLLPEMQRQINRWGGSMADWQNNIAYMRNQISNRCTVVAGKIDTCYDLKPVELNLNVVPANSGNIKLDGVLKAPYVWKNLIAGDSTYTLKATPTAGQYWTFDYWEKFEPSNSFSPNSTTDQVQYAFSKKDSVIAHFKYFNYDSIEVTFDVTPPGTGGIIIDGVTLNTYPTTIALDKRNTYNITAFAYPTFGFTGWQKLMNTTSITPSLNSISATLDHEEKETITAEFYKIPLPPPPPPNPLLSNIDKDVLFIPNAISPNGDGKNDVFNIKVGKDVVGLDLNIYNRWGNLVYNTNDINQGWDGTFNDKAVETGVYFYYFKVRLRSNAIKDYKGEITVIR